MKNILHFAINEISVTEVISAKYNQQILNHTKEAGFKDRTFFFITKKKNPAFQQGFNFISQNKIHFY